MRWWGSASDAEVPDPADLDVEDDLVRLRRRIEPGVVLGQTPDQVADSGLDRCDAVHLRSHGLLIHCAAPRVDVQRSRGVLCSNVSFRGHTQEDTPGRTLRTTLLGTAAAHTIELRTSERGPFRLPSFRSPWNARILRLAGGA
jgi:hypothetical protein